MRVLSESIAFVGGGNMAMSLLSGLIGSGADQMGAVMGQLMGRIQGRFDGKDANRIVREELAG